MTDIDVDMRARQAFLEMVSETAPDIAHKYKGLVTAEVGADLFRNEATEDIYVPSSSSGYRLPASLRSKDDVNQLLAFAYENDVNDIKFGDGEAISVRVHGKIFRLSERKLANEELRSIMTVLYEDSSSIVTSVLGGDRKDFAYTVRQGSVMVSRWRVSVTLRTTYSGIGFRVTCRKISVVPPDPEDVRLEADVIDSFMNLDRGMILVTGPTGSGKSTTLAALTKNRLRSPIHSDHLITIEAPVEYLHDTYATPFSEVTQWEVPRMLHSFAYAVETSLRNDPDLVMIGELRDRETMRAGIEVCLTGHGMFGTLHTSSAVQTVTRFLQSFSAEEVPAVQYDLVDNLHMILSQLLRAGPDGRRVALRERLHFDGQIKDQLRSAKNLTQKLREVMERYGRLMVEEAEDKYREGLLTKEELDRIRYMDAKERSDASE